MTTSPLQGRSVTLFCGGRGAATLARELLRVPDIDLSLVVNGYDNGLSTGALRAFVPGMLGLSDFRKSLVHHLDGDDPAHEPLLTLLEHRFPLHATWADLAAVLYDLTAPQRQGGTNRFATLGDGTRAAVVRDLSVFTAYAARQRSRFDLTDCSLGNLVLAGAYLRLGRDFNAAVRAGTDMFGSPVRIVNVTNGENAFLVALKADGTVLVDEADIVAPQAGSRITDLVLLREPLTARERDELTDQTPPAARAYLQDRRAPVSLSEEARECITGADLVVYGSGTPHSSLLPTYLTPGVADALALSGAQAKVFLVNISADHDVRGFSAPDLLECTLGYLGDPGNHRRLVSHVLSHRGSAPSPQAPAVPAALADGGIWAGARWLAADLEHPRWRGRHCGERTVAALSGVLCDSSLLEVG